MGAVEEYRQEVLEVKDFLDGTYAVSFRRKMKSPPVKLDWASKGVEKFFDRVILNVYDTGEITRKIAAGFPGNIFKQAISYGQANVIISPNGAVRYPKPTKCVSKMLTSGDTIYREELDDGIELLGFNDQLWVEYEDEIIVLEDKLYTIFYKQDSEFPCGRSRVTLPIRQNILAASRNNVRLDDKSDITARRPAATLETPEDLTPEELLDVKNGTRKIESGENTVLVLPEGAVYTQLQESSGISDFLQIHEKYAKDVAASFNVSAQEFGITQANPASAESLYASKDDLILEVKNFTDSITPKISEIFKYIQEITGEPLAKFYWADPSTPSKNTQGDAFIKFKSFNAGFAESREAMAWLGVPENVISSVLLENEILKTRSTGTETESTEEVEGENA